MSRFKSPLQEIARREGISVKQVYHEMQSAVDAACQSDDPMVRSIWRQIQTSGKRPMPEDLIRYCVKIMGP